MTDVTNPDSPMPQQQVPKNVWGPALWTVMHSFAYAYPYKPTFEQRAAATAFLDSLRDLIPCPECKMHYAQTMEENPPALGNRPGFAKWVVGLHNAVNGRLKRRTWSPEEAEKYWTSDSEGCGCEVKKRVRRRTVGAGVIGVIVGVFVALVAMLLASACRKCRAP